MKQITILGMSCPHCVVAVKRTLTALGLEEIGVCLDTGLATFSQVDIPASTVATAIEEEGFDVGAME